MTIDRMRSKPFLQEPARVPLVFAHKLSDDSRIRNRNNLHRQSVSRRCCECGARVSARVPAGARELSGRLAVTSSTLLMIDSCVCSSSFLSKVRKSCGTESAAGTVHSMYSKLPVESPAHASNNKADVTPTDT